MTVATVHDSLGGAVREALEDGPIAMRQLAEGSGLSYDVLRSWRSGRRRPHAASALRLARGLRAHAARLQGLADAITAAAQTNEVPGG